MRTFSRPALAPPLRAAASTAAMLATPPVAGLGARHAGGSGPGRLDDGLNTVVERVPAGRGGPARRVFSVGDPARATALTGEPADPARRARRPRPGGVLAAAGSGSSSP